MLTPAIVFLMITNSLTASGAIFTAWQISCLSLGRKQQPTNAKRSDDTARGTGDVEDRALEKAA
jgi:hypothetical protein